MYVSIIRFTSKGTLNVSKDLSTVSKLWSSYKGSVKFEEVVFSIFEDYSLKVKSVRRSTVEKFLEIFREVSKMKFSIGRITFEGDRKPYTADRKEEKKVWKIWVNKLPKLTPTEQYKVYRMLCPWVKANISYNRFKFALKKNYAFLRIRAIKKVFEYVRKDFLSVINRVRRNVGKTEIKLISGVDKEFPAFDLKVKHSIEGKNEPKDQQRYDRHVEQRLFNKTKANKVNKATNYPECLKVDLGRNTTKHNPKNKGIYVVANKARGVSCYVNKVAQKRGNYNVVVPTYTSEE